jgi:hypothetical protein
MANTRQKHIMSDITVHPRKIALIGHSGAGKSACLKELGIDRNRADMDMALGTVPAPSLAQAAQWLVSTEDPIMAVSNHPTLLDDMRQAKRRGEQEELFRCALFVYLRKPKNRLERHLKKPRPDEPVRPLPEQRFTLDSYDCFDARFQELADRTINCPTEGVAEVAEKVKAVALGSQTFGVGKPDDNTGTRSGD